MECGPCDEFYRRRPNGLTINTTIDGFKGSTNSIYTILFRLETNPEIHSALICPFPASIHTIWIHNKKIICAPTQSRRHILYG